MPAAASPSTVAVTCKIRDAVKAGRARRKGVLLSEWLESHRLLGVGAFVLYDDASSDETAAYLAGYASLGGPVTLVRWWYQLGGSSRKTAKDIQTAGGVISPLHTFVSKPSGAESFFKRKFFALRSIPSNLRSNRSYSRDFSAV